MVRIMLATLLQDPQLPAPADLTREQILQQDIDNAIRKLSGDDYWEATLARSELLAIGRAAIKPLIEAFHAHAGGTADDEKRIRVRYWVCELLGELREASDEAINILIRSLGDRAVFGLTKVSTAAAISLGRLGSERAIEPLLKALESLPPEGDKMFKAELIVALGNLRATQAEDLLREAFQKDDGKTFTEEFDVSRARVVSALAAEALGKIRARNSIAALCRRIDDPVTDPLTNYPLAEFIVQAIKRIDPVQGAKKDDEVRKWAQEQRDILVKAEKAKAAAENKAKTLQTMDKIRAALEKYRQEKGLLPDSLQLLVDARMLDATDLNDGWGNRFSYNARGTGGAEYDLVSYADDGQPGGTDINEDIWNHNQWQAEFEKQTVELLKKVADAVERFRKDQGRYPFSLINLNEKPVDAKQWPEKGYLPDVSYPIKDRYGGTLQYLSPGKNGKPFDLRSLGMDHREGGEGPAKDVSLWDTDWKAPDGQK